MKKLTLLVSSVILLFPMIGFGYEFVTTWSDSFEKEVSFVCDESSLEVECSHYCGASSCDYIEPICHNCIGDNLLLTSFFRNVGRSYIAGENLDKISEMFYLLFTGNFVSVNSKSIYNSIYPLDDPALKERFQSLCDDNTEYPTVLFSKDNQSEIDTPRFIICSSTILNISKF